MVYILLLLFVKFLLKRQLLLNTTFFERYVSTDISIISTFMFKLSTNIFSSIYSIFHLLFAIFKKFSFSPNYLLPELSDFLRRDVLRS